MKNLIHIHIREQDFKKGIKIMEQKLINEYNELCERLENLQEWLSEDHSDLDLDDSYFQLMRRQAVVMDEYAGILETRMNILGIRY